jgi:excisionase family DNA binding protein
VSALEFLSEAALRELVALVADEVARRGTASHGNDRDTAGTSVKSTGRWLTVAEAAEYLRCNPQRVRNLRSSRRLTPYVEGGRALCDRREVEALIEGGT